MVNFVTSSAGGSPPQQDRRRWNQRRPDAEAGEPRMSASRKSAPNPGTPVIHLPASVSALGQRALWRAVSRRPSTGRIEERGFLPARPSRPDPTPAWSMRDQGRQQRQLGYSTGL